MVANGTGLHRDVPNLAQVRRILADLFDQAVAMDAGGSVPLEMREYSGRTST